MKAIYQAVIEHAVIENVRAALLEDVGAGDLTAQLVPADAMAQATVISREVAVLCGQPWFDETFRQAAPSATLTWHVAEGARMSENQTIVTITGNARELLTAERTAQPSFETTAFANLCA
jgi:nicotinate-nucleotide pyrophosphorylase (carboxylating)